MTSLFLIWTAVLLGYAASRAAEWRIHRRNYQILAAAGADERAPRLMRIYYTLQPLMIVAAVAEQLVFYPEVSRQLLLGGLTAILAGQALRFWAIRSLGTLWTMRCMALPGLRHRRQGPYRFVENPEYVSRLIDGVGICLIFGAKLAAIGYLVTLLVLHRRLVAAERLQVDELEAERARPVPEGIRAS